MKRVLAWIGIIAIVALYLGAVAGAFMGGDMAVPIAMACIVTASYLAFYFHLGKIFADVLKNANKKNKHEKEQNNGKEELHDKKIC